MDYEAPQYLREIHLNVVECFDLAELQYVAFHFNIDWDDLPGGSTISSKSKEIILYLARRNQLDDLLIYLKKQRSHITWSDIPKADQLLKDIKLWEAVEVGLTDVQTQLPAGISNFIGRKEDLQWIINNLLPHRSLTLVGSGGIGKTTLAVESIIQLQNTGDLLKRFPDGVIFFSFYNQSNLEAWSAHIVRSIYGQNAPDLSISSARAALLGKHLLLVLDGTEEAEDLNKILGCRDNNHGLLITTRLYTDVPDLNWMHTVNKLEISEASNLLQSWTIQGLTKKKSEILCNLVDGHPLAIKIIGHFLQLTNEPVDKYIDWLKSDLFEALVFGINQEKIIEILLDKTLSKLSGPALELMTSIGIFGANPIDFEFLINAIGLSYEEARKPRNELNFSSVIQYQGEKIVISHSLIYSYVRSLNFFTDDLVIKIARKIEQKCEDLINSPFLQIEWIFHFESSVILLSHNFNSQEKAKLFTSLGKFFRNVANYSKSKTYFEKALVIRKEILGNNHFETLSSYKDIGLLYINIGEFEDAKFYLFDCMKLLEGSPEENDELMASILNDIGEVFRNQGNFDEAQYYLERSISIWEDILNADPIQVSYPLNNLGLLYQNTRQFNKAKDCFTKCLQLCVDELGEDHYKTGMSYNNLGFLLSSNGVDDKSSALIYYEKALEIKEKTLGVMHPSTALTMGNIGSILQAMKKFDDAQTYLEKALSVQETVFGLYHPYTAIALNNMGHYYQTIENFQKAKPYYMRALKSKEKIYGTEHPGTALSLYNLGALLFDLGEYTEVEEYYREALLIWEEIYGENSIYSALVLNNLGKLYEKLEKFEEANDYLKKAVSASLVSRGEIHADTAKMLNNLGKLATMRGNYAEAETHLKRANKICLELEDPGDKLVQTIAENMEHLNNITKQVD